MQLPDPNDFLKQKRILFSLVAWSQPLPVLVWAYEDIIFGRVVLGKLSRKEWLPLANSLKCEPPATCVQGNLDPSSLVALYNNPSSGLIVTVELFLPLMPPFCKMPFPSLLRTQPTHTQTSPLQPSSVRHMIILSVCTHAYLPKGHMFALVFLPALSQSNMLQNQNSSILHRKKREREWHLLRQQVRTEKAQQQHLHTEISLLCILARQPRLISVLFLIYNMHQCSLAVISKGKDKDQSTLIPVFSFFSNSYLFFSLPRAFC